MNYLKQLLFLLPLILLSCNINKEQILEEANAIVYQMPDSALTILSKIEAPSKLEKKDKADYWRIRSYIDYKKHNAMTIDSLILYSLKYYQETKDSPNLLESYLLAGEYYKWKNQLDSVDIALNLGLKESIVVKDSSYISQFLYQLGTNQLAKRNNIQAVKYFKERINISKDSHNSYYLTGIFSDDDSTKYYMDKAVELALQQTDTLSAAHYLRNYAATFIKHGEYGKAQILIKRTGELSDFYKDFGVNHLLMTQIYISIGKLDSAQYYLDRAKQEYTKNSFGSYNHTNIIGNKNAFYTLQAIIDTKNKKDLDLVPMYSFNDSIISETMRKHEILLEQTYARSSLEQQNTQLLVNKQRTRIILISIVVFLVFAIIAVYLYSSKKKQKLAVVEERAESLQRLFKEALNVKDEKQANSNQFRKTLLQQLGIIKLVATVPTQQAKGLLNQIIDISDESISTESLLNWKDLYAIIDSIYNNFHTELIEKYGHLLNEKEVQLCCLLRADFSTVEISAVMQQSSQTVYQRKSTVRSKLNMEDKEDIILFLIE